MGTELIKHVVSEQELREELSTEPGWPKIECNSDEEPTSENDVADLDDYTPVMD